MHVRLEIFTVYYKVLGAEIYSSTTTKLRRAGQIHDCVTRAYAAAYPTLSIYMHYKICSAMCCVDMRTASQHKLSLKALHPKPVHMSKRLNWFPKLW